MGVLDEPRIARPRRRQRLRRDVFTVAPEVQHMGDFVRIVFRTLGSGSLPIVLPLSAYEQLARQIAAGPPLKAH